MKEQRNAKAPVGVPTQDQRAESIWSDIAGEPRTPFQYLDKGNSAVAEVGEHRHELQGAIAFAAWLGVNAALLSSTRAKMEAFMEWAWITSKVQWRCGFRPHRRIADQLE
jgi:NADH dehydrogenase FAD-containing subunit